MSDQNQGQLSDTDLDLLIEQFGGEVESQFAKASFMRSLVKVRTVMGTDTITNNRAGKTELQALVPGNRPPATQTGFGKVQVTVDTVILARSYRSMLNELQTHFDARMELAQDQGKEHGKFFDQAFIIMAIKGSHMAAPTFDNDNGAFGAGKSIRFAALNDHLDPDKLEAGISDIVVQMEEEEIPVEELVCLVRPATFQTLKNNNKLLSRDYAAGNGDFARGIVYEVNGCRIIKTARIPTGAITGHKLSNAANGFAYDLSSAEADAVAVILHPKSLFAGETIPMTVDIWFNKEEKTWVIDSFAAFAVTVNRPDCCGTVNKYRPGL